MKKTLLTAFFSVVSLLGQAALVPPAGVGDIGRKVQDPASDAISRHRASRATQNGPELAKVVERVAQRFVAVPHGLAALSPLYRVELKSTGFTFLLEGSKPGDGIAISQTSVTAGNRHSLVATSDWIPDGNTASRQLGPSIAERVTARSEEAEWDLVLAAAPQADLEVRSTLSTFGSAAIKRSKKSVVWNFEGSRRIELGPVVVIDASGDEIYRTLPDISSHLLEFEIPNRILAVATYPVTIDPVFTAEYPATEPIYGGASGHQSNPHILWNGSSFLAAWEDERDRYQNYDYFRSISVARISRSGETLDPLGVKVADNARNPHLAWNGTEFLLAYNGYDGAIYAKRLTAEGRALNSEPLLVARGPTSPPQVASDGDGFLISWNQWGTGYLWYDPKLRAARVSSDGRLLDGDPIEIEATGSYPSVAFGDGVYFVAYEGYGDGVRIRGKRVRPDGTIVDTSPILVNDSYPGQFLPKVQWTGEVFAVVWEDNRTPGVYYDFRRISETDVYGARVTSQGEVLDPIGIALAALPKEQRRPSFAASPDGALLVYEQSDYSGNREPEVHAVRLSSDLTSMESDPLDISPLGLSEQAPVVASDGTSYVAVWSDRRGGDFDVYSARVGDHVEASVLLSISAKPQFDPSIAWNGQTFLIAWTDVRTGPHNQDVYAARMTPEGKLLDGSGLAVSTAANSQINPEVAWDGANFVVTWQDRRRNGWLDDIYAARVSSEGAVLDPEGIVVDSSNSAKLWPKIASSGTESLIVWASIWDAETDISGSLLRQDGSIVPISVSDAPSYQLHPTVASNREGYLVAWTDYRNANPEQWDSFHSDIFAARITASGELLDNQGFPVSTAESDQLRPAIASDGASYLVAWEDGRRESTFWDVIADLYGTVITANGQVVDPNGFVIASAPNSQGNAAIGWSGKSYFIAWEDLRTNPVGASPVPKLGFAQVAARGDNLEPDGLDPPADEGGEYAPAISGALNSVAISYAASRPNGVEPVRAFVRILADDLDPLAPDTIPPETYITKQPQPFEASSAADFRFASSESGSSVECSLDGAPWGPCAMATRLDELRDGSHTLGVRAQDPAGNVDLSPAIASWVSDVTAPIITFVRPLPGIYQSDVPVASADLGQSDVSVVSTIGELTVEISATDEHSGVTDFRVLVDGHRVRTVYDRERNVHRFVLATTYAGVHSIEAIATNGTGLIKSSILQVVAVQE